MIEPYQWLFEHAYTLGIYVSHIGPASVDLELGNVDPLCFNEGKETFLFEPGKFYLASTIEYIYVPDTHCAFVNMRSSFARKGLGHKMAGFIDPGFEGEITLELETANPLEISRGERIVQLVFARLTETTEKPYVGRYKGQRGPTKAY